MSGLILLRPWWLLALPLLAILLWRRGPDAGGWDRVIGPEMLAGLRRLGLIGAGARRRQALAISAAALLALALAGPALPRPDAPVFAQTDAIVIAMDMSPAVAQGPALADAQAAAAQVLGQNAGRPVGLILYSGEAFAVAAPTSDPATLESQIAVLGPDTMPAGGSRPAAALSLARQMLAGLKRADVILISAGAGITDATRTEAAKLADAGIRLSALMLTDAPDLRDLAGGRIATARAPDALLDRLGASGIEPDPALTALQYREIGPLIAALAALPLLALFRRRA